MGNQNPVKDHTAKEFVFPTDKMEGVSERIIPKSES